MQIIGVIDVAGGRAVHARGGQRAMYSPVTSAAGVPVDGDACALARAYVEQLGVAAVYVAALDAIARGFDALDVTAIACVAALGVPVWVDAGVTSGDQAQRVLAAGATHVVVGLETLPSFDALAAICSGAGRDRVVFSLDLRGGVPVSLPDTGAGGLSAGEIARRAAATGVTRMIVLDLARVGMRRGLGVSQIAAIRQAVPHVEVLAGGGVRDHADLAALEAVGCTGALVATALLDGTITAAAGRSPTARSSPRPPSRSP